MSKIKSTFIALLLILSPLITNWDGGNSPRVIEVRVSEFVPWANCKCSIYDKGYRTDYDNAQETNQRGFSHDKCSEYICKIEPWFSQIQSMMWTIIKIFTALATLAWVLFIVINWIMLSMWWMDSWMKEAVKWRIIKTLWWLILLLLSWVILNMIAPWIYN